MPDAMCAAGDAWRCLVASVAAEVPIGVDRAPLCGLARTTAIAGGVAPTAIDCTRCPKAPQEARRRTGSASRAAGEAAAPPSPARRPTSPVAVPPISTPSAPGNSTTAARRSCRVPAAASSCGAECRTAEGNAAARDSARGEEGEATFPLESPSRPSVCPAAPAAHAASPPAPYAAGELPCTAAGSDRGGSERGGEFACGC